MKSKRVVAIGALLLPLLSSAATSSLLGWNNLGMHCMDSDYSVFSILPPYNTVEAQLIVSGRLVTNGAGYRVSYQAVADASGSLNSTTIGKGNFYQWCEAVYGAALVPEQGLLAWPMPGLSNTPVNMLFEATNTPAPGASTKVNWWRAEGIPITPYDDAMHKNPYALMRLIAWNGTQPIMTNDVVLPVSDEMDCRACHASGTQSGARPAAGWVWDGLPERDYRLNILRLHDETEFAAHEALYRDALRDRGFNAAGLYRSVTVDQQPVLCAKCHASEALGAPSYGSIPALTTSVHAYHAEVTDPLSGTTLDSAANRSACYRCHPGAETKCLRGAMGSAPAPDGAAEMHCQSCHGNMSEVGKSTRVGWFMEPNCQSCHTGNAVNNSGAIRFTSVFTNSAFGVRQVSNLQFGTQPNIPAAGISLYRFSAGHGGLQCSACHGSTHAEFPSTHANDNVRNERLQGHAGVMVECTACHTSMPNSANGGPHGLHAIGQGWTSGSGGVTKHADRISALGGVTACQPCHGTDYRGTDLSRAHGSRNISMSFDGTPLTLQLHRGAEVGCYNCHNGPFSSNPNTTAAPVVVTVVTNTTNDKALAFELGPTGTGINWRALTQPASGTIGVSNNVATYHPLPGFVGSETFTYAAYNGAKNSSLATGTVSVAQGPYSLGIKVLAPASYPAQWPVAFTAVPSLTNHVGPVTYVWSFGDSTGNSAGPNPTNVYAQPGVYQWSVTATAGSVSAVRSGSVTIGSPVNLSVNRSGGQVILNWPRTVADTVLEFTPILGNADWKWVTNTPVASPASWTVTLPSDRPGYFRVRRPW